MKEEKEKGMWGGEGKGKDPTHVMILYFVKHYSRNFLAWLNNNVFIHPPMRLWPLLKSSCTNNLFMSFYFNQILNSSNGEF